MQIHELNNYTGTPGSTDYLALDTGSETFKISADFTKVLVLQKASFKSLPQTITDSRITSDMVALKADLGTPSAQIGDWTVTTSDGSLTVSGSMSGSTTITLYLMKSR